MQITIDVPEHEGDIWDQVISAIADKQLRRYMGADEDGEAHYGPSALQDQVRREVQELFTAAVEPHVKDAVEATLARGVPKTDRYGDLAPGGGTQTVAEKIHEELSREIVQRHRDSYNNRSESVLSRVIREQIDEALVKEFAAEVKAAKDLIHDRLKTKAAALLAAESLRATGIR
jgi:hypothetical protein